MDWLIIARCTKKQNKTRSYHSATMTGQTIAVVYMLYMATTAATNIYVQNKSESTSRTEIVTDKLRLCIDRTPKHTYKINGDGKRRA